MCHKYVSYKYWIGLLNDGVDDGDDDGGFLLIPFNTYTHIVTPHIHNVFMFAMLYLVNACIIHTVTAKNLTFLLHLSNLIRI